MDATMTDTDLHEVDTAIEVARREFIDLCQKADPAARVLDGQWTVHDMAAHVATVSQRYVSVAERGEYRRAESPRDVDRINAEEVEAVRHRPLRELLTQLDADSTVIRASAERLAASGRRVPFHGGASIDALAGATNWLGELRIHGRDIAQAVGAPWSLPERDMLLVLNGLQQIVPGYLDPVRAAGRDVMVELRVPSARRWIIHVHDGVAETRPRAPGDRPHAVLRAPAAVLALCLYQRIGQLDAARRGMVIVGGTRPWRALSLPALFQQP